MRRNATRRRAGFTLAEMLMAVAIIAVLIGLGAYAVLKFGNTGPYQATVANLAKLKGFLDTQWKAVADKAGKDPINVTPAALSVASLTDGQARQKFVEARITQAFPISFAEVMVPASQPAVGVWEPYRKYLDDLGVNAGNAASFDPSKQQAVLLLMILERGPQNPGMNAETLGPSIALGVDLGIANKPTPYGCLDGWGRPLHFSRFYRDGTKNTLGIVSAGANAKFGLGNTIDLSPNSANKHTLKPTPPNNLDAEDNVVIPE